MGNLFNNVFGISQRATGQVDSSGKVTIQKIFSYDLVSNPGFSSASFDTNEKLQKLLKRQKLLEDRKKKIEILNKLSNE